MRRVARTRVPTLLLPPIPGHFRALGQGGEKKRKGEELSGEEPAARATLVQVLKQLTGPSSHGRCSPETGSWSFGVKLGLGGCLGWNCWKLWNALENQSPLHHSPLLVCHFLGPCLRKTESPLMGMAWAVALRCSFRQRIPALMHCRSEQMTLLRGHYSHSWNDLAQGGTW